MIREKVLSKRPAPTGRLPYQPTDEQLLEVIGAYTNEASIPSIMLRLKKRGYGSPDRTSLFVFLTELAAKGKITRKKYPGYPLVFWSVVKEPFHAH